MIRFFIWKKKKARLDNQSVVAYNYYKNLIEKKGGIAHGLTNSQKRCVLAYDALADKKAQDIKIIN